MPEPDRLKKRKEQYRKLYEELGNIKADDKYTNEKNAVRDAFGKLNEKLNALTDNAENADKKLSKEDVFQLSSLYEETMKSLHSLNKKMGSRYQELKVIDDDEEASLTSKQKKEYKNLKNTMDVFDLVTNTVSKDVKAFHAAANKEESMSVREIYESSRKYSGYKVKEGQQLSTDAGNSNVRTAITLIDEDGNEVEGYFTQDAKNNISEEIQLKKSYEDNCKKFGPQAKSISFETIENIFQDFNLEYIFTRLIRGELLKEGFEQGLETVKKALPEDNNYDLDSLIGTPEKFRIFSDMMCDYAKITNRVGISNDIDISQKGNINRRNSAMSEMAKLLGCEDVIAESKNVKIVIDGKEVNGTFMKKAKGLDCRKEGLDSELMRLTPSSLEHMKVKKQIADLQVLDYICGNPDRHMGNLTYICEKDANGKVQLTGIQGIDNDSSFGKTDFSKLELSSVQLDAMRIITKSTADKILSLSKETLVNMFYEYELDGMEIENMTKRLENLQSKIREDDKVYAQGYGKGTLVDKRIKIVDDSELEMLSIRRELSGNDQNLFKRINSIGNVDANVDMAVRHYSDECAKSVKKFTSDSLSEFSDIMKDIASDDKMFQTGSVQYTTMRKSTKDVLDALRAYTGPDIIRGKTEFTYNDKLREIQKDIDKAIADCEAYQGYKHERNQRAGKPDIDPRPHKLTRAERRWNNVEKTLTFLKKQKEQFNKIEKSFKEYDNAMKNKKAVKDEINKIADEESVEMSNKLLKKSDEIKYDNYKQRSQYVIVEEALKLKEAVQYKDMAAQAEHQLQYNIKLGYAMNALKPEDRLALRTNIEELTGMKIELDDEQLFKRGVASRMVHEKLHLMIENEKRNLNRNEKEMLDNLQGVEIKNNSNGYDDLMKNPAFDRFYEKEKQKYDINSPRNADYKEDKLVTQPFEAAMSAVGLKEDICLMGEFRFINSTKEFAAEFTPEKVVAEEEGPKKETEKSILMQ